MKSLVISIPLANFSGFCMAFAAIAGAMAAPATMASASAYGQRREGVARSLHRV